MSTVNGLVSGLFEAHLQVANLERACDFYEYVLGFAPAHHEPGRRVSFYWISEQRRSMLGLWENLPWSGEDQSGKQPACQHLAFETSPADLGRAMLRLTQKGAELRNFAGEVSDVPSVFGWIPAAAIYFRDPDGHLLELIARLPGERRPEVGVVSLEEWNALRV